LAESDKTDVVDGAVPGHAGSAFAAPEPELTAAERDELIEGVAQAVVRRGMGTPAVFALEMHKPLCFFGSNLLLLGSPILGAFLGFGRILKFASLIEDRANVERLIKRVEELKDGKDGPAA